MIIMPAILLLGDTALASATTDGILPSSFSINDPSNRYVDVGTVGSPLVMTNHMLSTLIAPKPFICIFEVRDSSDITQFIAWQSGTLKRDTELSVGVSWIPEKPGLYSFRAYAVSSFDNPESVHSGGFMYLYVTMPGHPITVGTGSTIYREINSIDVVGRVSEEYFDTNIELQLWDADGKVSREVIQQHFNGKFYHTYSSQDLDFGEYTIIARIEGLEYEAKTSFTYGLPELRGIRNNLTLLELTDKEQQAYTIGYTALNGQITNVVMDDSGNYSLKFELANSGDGGLVVRLPRTFLDKMTPLGDLDLFCTTGEREIAARHISSDGYRTPHYSSTFYCPFSQGTSSISVVANTDPAKQD